jgi:hypothetical protein
MKSSGKTLAKIFGREEFLRVQNIFQRSTGTRRPTAGILPARGESDGLMGFRFPFSRRLVDATRLIGRKIAGWKPAL